MSEIQEQAVQVTWKTTETTLKSLLALIKAIIENQKRITHGEQSLKKLNIQNKQLESVNIVEKDLKLFRRELKKYSVDFSIKKNPAGEHVVFFKGQDVDRVYQGLEKCVKNFEREPKKRMEEVMETAEKQAATRAKQREADSQDKSNDKSKVKQRGMER